MPIEYIKFLDFFRENEHLTRQAGTTTYNLQVNRNLNPDGCLILVSVGEIYLGYLQYDFNSDLFFAKTTKSVPIPDKLLSNDTSANTPVELDKLMEEGVEFLRRSLINNCQSWIQYYQLLIKQLDPGYIYGG